jgi:hypothetical protein
MPWEEVFDHLHEIIQTRVSDVRWAISASSYPHMDKGGRRSVDSSLTEYAAVNIRPGGSSGATEAKHSAFDAMPDEGRVLSIGSCLASEGMGFLDRRQYHREWLAEKGISPEDVLLRYTDWRAKSDAARERRSGDGGDD